MFIEINYWSNAIMLQLLLVGYPVIDCVIAGKFVTRTYKTIQCVRRNIRRHWNTMFYLCGNCTQKL